MKHIKVICHYETYKSLCCRTSTKVYAATKHIKVYVAEHLLRYCTVYAATKHIKVYVAEHLLRYMPLQYI